MANRSIKSRTEGSKKESAAKAAREQGNKTHFFSNFYFQSAILAIICFIFYANTFQNEYAVDDLLIIEKNAAISNGIAGIPALFKSDMFESYYKQYNAVNRLSGGRYRPLSLVTFAVEQQLFGTVSDSTDNTLSKDDSAEANKKLVTARHVDNVLLYIISVVLLLSFLRSYIFPGQPLVAFLSVLLFAVHPIHTEVVANIKSRDELLSLIFISLTFIYAFKYREKSGVLNLAISLLCFLLALLSKEYAVSLILLLPIAFYLFRDTSVRKSILSSLPFLAVLVLYLILRYSVVSLKGAGADDELLNNPYLLASPLQKLATEIATLLNYLKLLIFPHPLSVDYSYNQIPYKNLSDPLVLLSVMVYGGMTLGMFILLKKRHVLGFAIAFFLFNLFLVSNLVFSIGATMGERLIYHSSLGFCIAIAYLLYYVYERIQNRALAQRGMVLLFSVIVVLCGIKTTARNADWKNNRTLFTKDVETVPNSAWANGNAGAAYNELANLPENADQKRELLQKGIVYMNKAIAIYPKYTSAYLNRGTAFFELGDIEKAKQDWDTVRKFYPTYPTLPELYTSYYINNAISKYGSKGMYAEAIAELRKGTDLYPQNPVLWYNIAYYYSVSTKYDSAIIAWQKTIDVAPNDTLAPKSAAYIKAVMGAKGK